MSCLQDVVLTVPQYPFVLEDSSTLPFEKCWVVHPLFFTCYLRPTDRLLPKASHTYGEDISKTVWYSTAPQPSKSWTCTVLELWTGWMFRSITSPPHHLHSTWAKSPMMQSPMWQVGRCKLRVWGLSVG
jgi:hypothetical protein